MKHLFNTVRAHARAKVGRAPRIAIDLAALAVMRRILASMAWLLAILSGGVWALSPPTAEQLDQLRASGTLAAQVQKAKDIGNHRMDPQSIDMLRYRVGRANGSIAANAPPPNWQGGLPTTGSPKVLVLLVDFPDYPHDAVNTPTLVSDRMFGAGGASVAGYPYESLAAYYQRSSYGALNLQGFVTPWYRAKYARSYYESLGSAGYTVVIDEALNYLKSTGHTFAQYDNNSDGYFDTLYVKWTGPAGPWASFWWAMQSYYSGSILLDGKRPRKYIWSWIANVNYYPGGSTYTPQVDIHETGHALGLPDYYDYDSTVGPKGGLGGLDMMDANRGDHGAFSKFVLGWLNPAVVSSGTSTFSLRPTGTNPDAVMLMPGAVGGNPFGEYFLAQYRSRAAGNDSPYPTDGMTLWHIDATLNAYGTDYLYNNSYTDHKLVRLVQADGLAQIENGGQADVGDFYTSTKTFSPTTTPNSNRYSGAATAASITGIGTAGVTLPATFSIGAGMALTVSNGGGGTVTSNPAGIGCGATCTANFSTGTSVTLSAAPLAGYTFSGWSGACTGTGACVVSMTAAKAVAATFTPTSYTVTVSKAGTGTGSVVSSPAGINCGTSCSASFATNASVSLTATSAAGSTFAGWSGACSGTGACVVSVTAAKSVTATFNLNSYAVSVALAGTGTGVVSSSPAGINCGSVCSANFSSGASVNLTATPATGSTFTGWSGACSGTGACTVSATAAKSVTATFTLNSYTVSVAKAGTGVGTVSSAPAGINCGTVCAASFTYGSNVTLTATPSTGSTFAGWSGACTGTSACTVSATAAKSVTATFTLNSYALSVVKAGTGAGTVISTPGGINCGLSCSANFNFGGNVTLMATPAAGSTFAGWTGACTGTGACTVSMTAAQNVTATFNLPGYALSVTKVGTGTGTVASTPAGIACGTACSASFTNMTNVTLLATPAAGSSFVGWSGACSGAINTCTVSMSAAKTVTATFSLVSTTLTLGDALDNTSLVWSSSGNALWLAQKVTTSDGVDAAQSGALLNNQWSTLQTTVTGPGVLTFKWKVSSEFGWDFLQFLLDGVEQAGSIHGEVNWTQKSVMIPAGVHTLQWRYIKDMSISVGQDRGWVDAVTFVR